MLNSFSKILLSLFFLLAKPGCLLIYGQSNEKEFSYDYKNRYSRISSFIPDTNTPVKVVQINFNVFDLGKTPW